MPMQWKLRVLARSVILVVLTLGLAGCGGGPPPPTDKNDAVALLRIVLDAWQAGKTPNDLKNGTPAITAVDKMWSEGTKLSKFEIDDAAAQPNGYDLSCPVKLWLGDGKKPPVSVRYVIALSPQRVVTRDFGN
jgi:hypothetical protein